jgi:hypothetical protein
VPEPAAGGAPVGEQPSLAGLRALLLCHRRGSGGGSGRGVRGGDGRVGWGRG